MFLDDTDGFGGTVEDRNVFGVENSSMFLECSPKSQRALIYWQLQKLNDDRKLEVCVRVCREVNPGVVIWNQQITVNSNRMTDK